MPENVVPTPIEEIRVGDVIWVDSDRDWLRVHRIDRESAWGVELYRNDGSVADFDDDATVLRRVGA